MGLYGYESILSVKSRFIDEIPIELLDCKKLKTFKHQNNFSNQQYKDELNNDFNIGDNVEHKVFGKGEILKIDGFGDLEKISIRFRGNIIKKLIKKYANLSKIK